MENDTPDETYGLQALSQIKYNDKKDRYVVSPGPGQVRSTERMGMAIAMLNIHKIHVFDILISFRRTQLQH